MQTKEKLLSTALQLIWDSHYYRVGVNEICLQAGVTKGAFYHHFDSKATLFCEATIYYWDSIRTDLEAMFADDFNALQQLENLIAYLNSSLLSDDQNAVKGCPFFSVGTQLGTDEPKVIEALTTLSDKAFHYNKNLISKLDAQAYVSPVADKDQLARLMYHTIHGVISAANITEDISVVQQDLPIALYRLLGLKSEFWFAEKAGDIE